MQTPVSDSLSILHSFGWILNLLEIALSKIYLSMYYVLPGVISLEAWDNVKENKSNDKILCLFGFHWHCIALSRTSNFLTSHLTVLIYEAKKDKKKGQLHFHVFAILDLVMFLFIELRIEY